MKQLKLLKNKRSSVMIFGMGYVGLTLGVVLADVGFRVFGIEPRRRGLQLLKRGRPYIYETGLSEAFRKHFNRGFKFFEKPELPADVYVVAVGTPVDDKKKIPDLTFIKEVAGSIGRLIKPGDLIMLRSTVPVGTTRNVFLPIVEKHSGLMAGKDFYLVFAPERTVEGSALRELRTLPQIIGGIDDMSVRAAERIFKTFVPQIISVSSLETAELVKLFNNSYRDVIFGFANEAALICDGFNVDPKEVIQAANQDYPRSNIPLPSPGVGGYCLTKDPFILLHSTKDIPAHPYIVFHARKVNEMMPAHVAGKVNYFLKHIAKKKFDRSRVAILGFAFKGHPETTDMRFSPTLDLIRHLNHSGVPLVGHDPKVEPEKIRSTGVRHVKNLEDAFSGSDGVVVMTNHMVYRDPRILRLLKGIKRPGIFVDPWQLHDQTKVTSSKGIHYSSLGFDTFLKAV